MPDELVVLGSSSGAPTRRRFASAYALTVTSTLFLIDCGAPVSSLLYEHGFDPLEVRSIFISHWHMDHVANLGLLLTHNHLLRRPRSLSIYGPKGTRGKVNRLLTDSLINPENLRYKLKVSSIKPGKKIEEGLLRVRFFETEHLSKLKYKTRFGGRATSCGMVLNGPGWRIVYSGDLTSPQELAPYIDGCDLLIHEMTHVRPEEVADFAAAAKVPHLLVSHISREYDETPEKIRKVFKKQYDGDLMIAEDGMRLKLSKASKSASIEEKLFAEKSDHAPLDSMLISPTLSEHHSRRADFIETLEKDFNVSPFFSRQLLKAAEEILVKPTDIKVDSGQIRLEVDQLGTDPAAGKAAKIPVVLTLYQGEADREVQSRERSVGLRRGRILRFLEEALDQGGTLAELDLAHLLEVSISTIRRDLRGLEAEGHTIYTQETLKGGLPGLGYRAQAIARWINGDDEEEIACWLHQSSSVIRDYIEKYTQVGQLYDQYKSIEKVAAFSDIPIRLVDDYLKVYRLTL